VDCGVANLINILERFPKVCQWRIYACGQFEEFAEIGELDCVSLVGRQIRLFSERLSKGALDVNPNCWRSMAHFLLRSQHKARER
jgi:hypothetical protein